MGNAKIIESSTDSDGYCLGDEEGFSTHLNTTLHWYLKDWENKILTASQWTNLKTQVDCIWRHTCLWFFDDLWSFPEMKGHISTLKLLSTCITLSKSWCHGPSIFVDPSTLGLQRSFFATRFVDTTFTGRNLAAWAPWREISPHHHPKSQTTARLFSVNSHVWVHCPNTQVPWKMAKSATKRSKQYQNIGFLLRVTLGQLRFKSGAVFLFVRLLAFWSPGPTAPWRPTFVILFCSA